MKTINFGHTQIVIGYDNNVGMYFASLDEKPCQYDKTQESAIEELGIRLLESGQLEGLDLFEFRLKYDSDLNIPHKLRSWLEGIKEDLSTELLQKYPDFDCINVRINLEVDEEGNILDYGFYSGYSDYDPHHLGVWGYGCVDLETEIDSIVADMLEDACEDYSRF